MKAEPSPISSHNSVPGACRAILISSLIGFAMVVMVVYAGCK
jgi:hypothetical protein